MGNKCCSWKSKSKAKPQLARQSSKDLQTSKNDFPSINSEKVNSANVSEPCKIGQIPLTDFKKLDNSKPDQSLIINSKCISVKNNIQNCSDSNEGSTKNVTDLAKFNSDNGKLNLNVRFTKNDFIKGKVLNKGRFGSVYTALSIYTGETVACKTLDLNLCVKEKNKAKVVEELVSAIEKLKNVQHKHLINYISTVDTHYGENDEFTIFYEFCNGGSIKTLLQKYGKFEEKVVKLYVKQIMEGLAYLHSNSIVHKNIKSSNILVDGNGTVRISDSLIDNIIMEEGQDYLEKMKNCKDIPYWISPDLVFNPLCNKTSFDIWSLGCLIIEMITAKPAWHHYNFVNSDTFIQFLSTTHCISILTLVTPTMPKKLTKSCISFLNICFSRSNSDSILLDLFNHSFLHENLEESLIESRQSTDNKLSVLSNSIINKSQNKKFVNILNSIDENPMFTVSVTMVSPLSQLNSINTTQNNLFNVLHQENRKILTENILEEIDTSKENSPGVMKPIDNRRYFEFNEAVSDHVIDHSKELVITEHDENLLNEELNCEIERLYDIQLINGMGQVELKISDIKSSGSHLLTDSKIKKIAEIDRYFRESEPFDIIKRKNSRSLVLNTRQSGLIKATEDRSPLYLCSNNSLEMNTDRVNDDNRPYRTTEDFIGNYIQLKD